MLEWSESAELPVHILLTKADKLKRGPQQSTLLGVRRSVGSEVSVQTFSATHGIGKVELTRKLNVWMTT
ncbi:MAG: GTP-binding protein [Candidatus Azotimanducaceae bacterium]|jgi:GTP-binding protein